VQVTARFRQHLSGGIALELDQELDIPTGTTYHLPQHGLEGRIVKCLAAECGRGRVLVAEAGARPRKLLVRGVAIAMHLDYEPPPPPRLLGWGMYRSVDLAHKSGGLHSVETHFELSPVPLMVGVRPHGSNVEATIRHVRGALLRFTSALIVVDPIASLSNGQTVDVLEARR
jgi:hypothetical protein